MRLSGRNDFTPIIDIKAICFFCYAALQIGEKILRKPLYERAMIPAKNHYFNIIKVITIRGCS